MCHEVLAGFADDQRRRGLERSTIQRRHEILAAFLVGRPLQVGSVDIEEWLDTKPLSNRTRASYLSTLSVFFQWLVRTGRLPENPVVAIPRPAGTRLLPRPIATNHLAHALSAADERMRAWLCLGAFAGFRCKEMAGLRREDVLDADDPALLLVSSPKGHKQRLLPLNPHVENSLRAYGLPRRGWVFCSQTSRYSEDRPLTPHTISRLVSEHFHALGIEATAHQLRHTFATAVYRDSADLRLTQELMGHANSNTTAIYAAFNPLRAIDVVRNLGC